MGEGEGKGGRGGGEKYYSSSVKSKYTSDAPNVVPM